MSSQDFTARLFLGVLLFVFLLLAILLVERLVGFFQFGQLFFVFGFFVRLLFGRRRRLGGCGSRGDQCSFAGRSIGLQLIAFGAQIKAQEKHEQTQQGHVSRLARETKAFVLVLVVGHASSSSSGRAGRRRTSGGGGHRRVGLSSY